MVRAGRTKDGRTYQVEEVYPGIQRVTWANGNKTDICVTDLENGPMTFTPSPPRKRSV